jgi:methionine synthase I (cobalamin-dependent)
MKKHKIVEVENSVNKVVEDYVKKRIGIGDFLKVIEEYEDCTEELIKNGKENVAALIDIVVDNLLYETQSDTYNPRDKNTTEKYIDWYYKKYVKPQTKKS